MEGMTQIVMLLRRKQISVNTAMSTLGIENIQVKQNTVDGDTFYTLCKFVWYFLSPYDLQPLKEVFSKVIFKQK